MEITKKIKAEIIFVMNDYWDSYLKGNLDHWANYLVNDYINIGSTEVEIWNSKKEIFDYTTSVIDQMVGFTQLRNKKTEIFPYDPYVMVHEYLDIYIKIDEKWTFYSKLRLSSLIQKLDTTWKILHQHGSYPDSKVMDGEFFAFDTLKSENLKLQEAIKNRTIELEHKNRELEIETALERVRTVAMSMNKSEDLLSICEVSFFEFQKLGIENLRNAIIHIPNDEKKYFMDYDFSESMGSAITKINYESHPIVADYLKKIKSAEDAFYEVVIKDDQLSEWNDFRKNTGQHDDPSLNSSAELHYYVFSIGNGGIGISTFKPIDVSQKKILKRFRNVFDLSYQRFTDISLAEAQAREAQIEAALERVRSLALGMHKSEEVGKVTDGLFAEFNNLSMNIIGCSIIVIDEEKDTMELWRARSDTIVKSFEISSFTDSMNITKRYAPKLNSKFHKARKKRNKYLVTELALTERTQFLNAIAEQNNYSNEEKSKLLEVTPKNVVAHYIFSPLGYLAVLSKQKLSDEDLTVARRYMEVFDFAYTRFLDIKNAEEQARDANIEAALERVRSRSLAMHSSDEFVEASDVMFDQLKKLEIKTLRIGIGIMNTENNTVEIWSRSEIKGKVKNEINGVVPSGTHPIFDNMVAAWKENEPFFASERIGDEVKEYYEKLAPCLSYPLPNEYNERESVTTFFFAQGSLNVISLEPLSEETCNIMIRFARVFGQIYQRFLDLKKAEAQAREAQIEASLERVRSSTMAMHTSEQLSETAKVLFEQIDLLGKIPDRMSIGIFNEKINKVELWSTDQDGNNLNQEFLFSMDEPTSIIKIYNAWKEGKESIIVNLTGKKLRDWLLFVQREAKLPIDKSQIRGRRVQQAAFFSLGFILTTTHEPIADEIMNLLVRFANVFDQTYTRFLDLQKAEAQAREAQIETALERVRSRSMGMQKSEELKEVIQVVYEQFVQLDIFIEHTGFIMDYKARDDMHIWLADQQGSPSKVTIPYFDSPHWNSFIEAKEKGMDFFVNHLSFEEKNKFYKDLFKFIPEAPEETLEFCLSCPGLAISTVLLENVGLYIENFSGTSYTDEENAILMRFGKVFQQTYTRFLDLQKAEAQAREAQIEAALEKVRSRSLAMHSSDEIKDVVVTVMEKMNDLSIEMNSEVSLATFVPDSNDLIHWYVNPDHVDGPVTMHLPCFDNVIFYDFIKARKSGKEILPVVYSFEEKNEYFEYTFKHSEFRIIPKEFKKWILEQPYFGYSVAIQKHSAIFFNDYTGKIFSEEENDVLIRFAKVFDQAYIRFLDLKKAEAQAREAQIETAMEHIRNRTLLMKDSGELNEAVAVFFQQFKLLDLLPAEARTYFSHVKTSTDTVKVWMTHADGSVMKESHITPMTKSPSLKKFYQKWKKNKEIINTRVYNGKSLKEYMKFLSTLPHVAKDKDYKKLFKSPPKQIVMTDAGFLQGFLGIMSFVRLKKETIDLLVRFAKVFEFTYTRFLDLQKAEEQAREAKIEASLERVRSKAMSMHKSDDLTSAVATVFVELHLLGLETIRCGVGIFDGQNKKVNVWTSSSSDKDDSIQVSGDEMLEGHPLLDGIYDAWQKQNDYSYILQGKDLKQYYNVVAGSNLPISVPKEKLDASPLNKQYYHCVMFPAGGLYAFREKEFSEEAKRLMKRFADVFHLTFTRHLDLKQAEVRARESEQQASLDRVRAEIASMRNTEDLEKITPLIWRELTTLGMPFFRCGVFIIDEFDKSAHGYLSTPSGKSLGTLHLKIDEGHWIDEAVTHWQKGKIYHGRWDREQFIAWTQTMIEQGFVENREHFQDGKEAPENLYLQLLPFSQGMLYVGSKLQLSEEEIELAQKLANAFGVAYSRYEDFQKLESANERKSKELEEARDLQLSMLPKTLPVVPNLEISAYMKTATEVGGDYYDFHVGEDGTLTTIIGDATGHGMKAGTLVTITKSLFEGLATGKNILETFSRISNVIKGMKLPQLSMCLAMIKIKGNELRISSAAMPPVLIYRNKLKKVEEVLLKGMPLGAIKNFPYVVEKRQVDKGDTLLLLSDGLPELANNKEQMFGYNKIQREFSKIGHKAPDDIVYHFKELASNWTNGNEPDDDITFVIIKVK